MSFNINEIADNYLCPCQTHGNASDTEIIVKDKRKFNQCTICNYPWAIFHPRPLDKCVSCRSSFHEVVVTPEVCSLLECFFCGSRIPQMVIIDHFQKIALLHLSHEDDISQRNVTDSEECRDHDWGYRFLNGQFWKCCNSCCSRIVMRDPKEIILYSTYFLNCCDNNRTRISAFRYLNYIILQCDTCLGETVVTSNETFDEWLSIGKWGLGFAEQEVLSINDLHVGDHLAYIRQFYEHHVIVVWVNPQQGKFKEIGFSRPYKSSNFENQYTLEGQINISDVLYKTIEDPLVVIHYLPLDCFHTANVVQRAFSRIQHGNYNIVTNNCEHMATWCKYGIYESIQVRKAIERFSKIGCEIIETHVIPNVKFVCEKVSRAAKEDPTIAQIQTVVKEHQKKLKKTLKNTLGFLHGEKSIMKENEPGNNI